MVKTSGYVLSTLAMSCTLLAVAPASGQARVGSPTTRATYCTETLIGTPLRDPGFSPEVKARLEQDLAIAQAALRIAPDREDSHIWVGRRLGYAGRLCEAIDAFSAGLAAHPRSYKLLRFRGQTWTRVRQFDRALQDFDEAARLSESVADSFEPDGRPNALDLPLSTYKSNIPYYRAQTLFATGDFQGLFDGMQRSRGLVATFAADTVGPACTFWQYLALRKLGKREEAARLLDGVPAGLKPIEDQEYYDIVQMLQGRLTREALLSTGTDLSKFAIAMEHRFAGDDQVADQTLRAIVVESPSGYWPAEVEIGRGRKATQPR